MGTLRGRFTRIFFAVLRLHDGKLTETQGIHNTTEVRITINYMVIIVK